MATTTFAAIQTAFRRALAAVTPSKRADVRFRPYDGSRRSFATWAQDVGAGAFRVFSLEHAAGSDILGPFDPLATTTEHELSLLIGYPLEAMREGVTKRLRGDVLIECDSFDLNAAIGQPALRAGTIWPAGMNDCRMMGQSMAELGWLRVLDLRFRVNYQRTLA